MPTNNLRVVGAREHNLKNITVEIPRDKLVVMTGLSGSGKSSLAFDTIFAEGQRRYVESLSAYARQYLGQMDKPDVDRSKGFPRCFDRLKSTSNNPRSTVGTVTEVSTTPPAFCPRGRAPLPVCGRIVQAVRPGDRRDDHERSWLRLLVWRRWCGAQGHLPGAFDEIGKSGFTRAGG